MAAYGLPKAMYHVQCLSFYMCGAPGTTDAGTDVDKSAGIEHAKTLLREAGYNNEKTVFCHSAMSALLDPAGLVIADQMRRAGVNVDFLTPDYATVAERRSSREPVESGRWSVVPFVWNGIDMTNPLSDPTAPNNCTDNYPGWYCDPKLTLLLMQYPETDNPAYRKQFEAQIQPEFLNTVNLVLAGQFSAAIAYRSDLKG